MDKKKVRAFQQKVLSFYAEHGRTLPWRKTANPYHILLSEVMLQQTQVDRVIAYYNRWTQQWPNVQDLANASRIDVLKEWSGLGYNNRAVNLHRAAQVIAEKYNGDVIAAVKDYKNVPGIGPYTAAAVQIFANNEDIITVDTNIRRILLHEFKLPNETPDRELWQLANRCLPRGRSRDWHNALMDYGATYLTSRKTLIAPKTRQSKFEGSDRQIRAKIVRELLRRSAIPAEQLAQTSGTKQQRVGRIIRKMEKDGLVRKDGNTYVLSEG
jgi:A/G-specific adenine glycosylase